MSNKEIPPGSVDVSAALLSQMFLYMASVNVDVAQFLHSIGMDPAAIQSPDARIPNETYLFIEDKAAEYTNDPYFGLHMGEFVQVGSWSILGYMMMNSQSVGTAMEKADRYSRIVGDLICAQTKVESGRIKIIYSTSPHAAHISRHCMEASFSGSVRMIRALTGMNLNPLEVCFTSMQPKETAEYERVFGCPVHFEQDENCITIDAQIMDIPILLPNAELLEYFENYAKEFLAKIDHKNEYTRTVTRLMLANLDDQKLSIDTIAKEMNLSVRTLQNRLSDEGVVFSELLRETRIKLAQKYLREEYTVETITYLLGFSEPSVFRKAFKKWSGITPGEYRAMSTK